MISVCMCVFACVKSMTFYLYFLSLTHSILCIDIKNYISGLWLHALMGIFIIATLY